ncbi:MAG: copper homeostasis protein CutC [Bacteroidota bacterium]
MLTSSTTGNMTLEICIDSLASMEAAHIGGADRIELCAGLAIGGTTPPQALLEACLALDGPPIMVMVRPRAGDFLYSPAEIKLMTRSIELVKKLGANGVVFGVLSRDGQIDRDASLRLLEAARPMEVTFHRAFDVCRDPYEGLDVLVELGVDHLLTSGQAPDAEKGIPLLHDLVSRSGGRLQIMAGAGVRSLNVGRIIRETGVSACHASASRLIESEMTFRHPTVYMGLQEINDYQRKQTDPILVQQLKKEMLAALAG